MNFRAITLFSSILVLCGALGLVGCEPEETPMEETTVTFAAVQEIFEVHGCADGSCHSSQGMQGGLSLEGNVAYDSLVEQACANPSATEAGILLVTPGEPDASFLYTKVTMTHSDPHLGLPMPVIGDALTVEESETIRLWIEDGALR